MIWIPKEEKRKWVTRGMLRSGVERGGKGKERQGRGETSGRKSKRKE